MWLVDAKDKVLGRVCADISRVLTGKHKPLYDPSLMTGDTVVVINCKDVAVTGKKREQKLYRKHSGWTGNLRTVVYKDLVAKKPNESVRLAVKGMLPRNKLRDRLLKQRLLLYEVRPHLTHLGSYIPAGEGGQVLAFRQPSATDSCFCVHQGEGPEEFQGLPHLPTFNSTNQRPNKSA